MHTWIRQRSEMRCRCSIAINHGAIATDVRRRAGGRLLRGQRTDGRQNPMHYPETQKSMNIKSERAISLARPRPLAVRFLEDPVRRPGHDIVIPEFVGTCELAPALPCSSVITSAAKAFSVPSQHPVSRMPESRCRSLSIFPFLLSPSGRLLFRWF